MDYSEDEQYDIYDQLAIYNNIELSTDDNHTAIIHEAYDTLSSLAYIERFAKACANSKLLPDFKQRSSMDGESLQRRSLTSYYPLLNRMIAAFDERYFYSPRVDVFFQACISLDLMTQHFAFERNPLQHDFLTGHCFLDTYHALIEKIRELCNKVKFKKKLKGHERSVRRREAKALMWEKKLFAWKSRHLIIPLTLEYKPEFRQEVTPELVQQHLQRLLGNRRSNNLLRGIENYVCRIEEGDTVGLHVHLLIAYAGKSHEDMSISKSICRYWETVITESMGYANSSSMYKYNNKLRTYGACAGQIDQHEHEKRQVLRDALRYLVKADQFLKRKSSKKFKTFGMSQPREPSGMGRPRIETKEITDRYRNHADSLSVL
jgi:hypothetical protein